MRESSRIPHLNDRKCGADDQLRLGRDEWRSLCGLLAVLEDARDAIGFGEQRRVHDGETEAGRETACG